MLRIPRAKARTSLRSWIWIVYKINPDKSERSRSKLKILIRQSGLSGERFFTPAKMRKLKIVYNTVKHYIKKYRVKIL
jgi:hypothetical protein